MKSIRELYKIGRGPSSSHTMGPARACEIFKARHQADHYRVILYGSLSLTGKGHLTDKVIIETLRNVDVVFSSDFVEGHPNAMDIIGFDKQGEEIATSRVFSIGGGTIRFKGEETEETPHIYPHQSFLEIKEYCVKEEIDLVEYVRRFEGDTIFAFLQNIWEAMKLAIENGLSRDGVLPGELQVERKARHLFVNQTENEPREIFENRMVSAFAFAVNETNASGGFVVTAPTCGASGTMPAVLKFLQERDNFSDEAIVKSLAVAGVIGNVIKHNATISGAEAGCQAEVGSACSMAAAAYAGLFELTLDQIEYAAEIALEHHLGLTCDPVLGYVQIPCIERNAVAALRAMDATRIAHFLFNSRKIDFDTVVETMFETGKDMPANYRETSCGGLAIKYKFKK